MTSQSPLVRRVKVVSLRDRAQPGEVALIEIPEDIDEEVGKPAELELRYIKDDAGNWMISLQKPGGGGQT